MFNDLSWTVFVQSASILLREGLEVILILSALIAYLIKVGARAKLPALYIGAGVGILGSFGLAVMIESFLGEEQNALLESVMLLLAAGLMVYVSGWLYVKQDPRAWQTYLKAHADQALVSKNTSFAIAVLSFFSVIREGGETVVFYHALSNTEGGWSASLALGFVSSAVVLLLLFIAMRIVTVRLPLRPLFLVTSAFLFVMAFRFLGDGIHELQEAHLLTESEISLPALLSGLGIQDSIEALCAQIVLVLGAALTLTALQFKASSTPPVANA